MKAKIHPKYHDVTVTCSCGNSFVTRSTMEKEKMTLDVCSMCHPFYTGTQKMLDQGGRVDRFRQKYAKKEQPSLKLEKTEEGGKIVKDSKSTAKKETKVGIKKTATKKSTSKKPKANPES